MAHLPAGYLLFKLADWYILTRGNDSAGSFNFDHTQRVTLLVCSLVGSVLPDIDLLYFYTIGGRRIQHHLYLPHLPAFWALVGAFIPILSFIYGRNRIFVYALVIVMNVFLHLILDTPMGGIAWLYPFKEKLFYLVKIPNRFGNTYLNFILHPTFLSELLICSAAVIVYAWANIHNFSVPRDKIP